MFMNYSGHPNDDSSKRFLARTTEVMLILGKDEMLVSDVKKNDTLLPEVENYAKFPLHMECLV